MAAVYEYTAVPSNTFDEPEEEIAHYIWLIGSPIVIAIGIIGNTLSILILSRKRMRKHTSAFYFTVLAVTDLLVLNVGLLRNFLEALMEYDPIRSYSQASCKIHTFLVYFLGQFSAWVLSSVTVERFISVWFPFKARYICTRKNAAIGLVILAVFLCSANVHFFWTRGLSTLGNDTVKVYCIYLEEYYYFTKVIWDILDSLLITYIPCACMVVLNILIIIKLKRFRRRNKCGFIFAPDCNSARVNSMTAMLLTVTFTFVLLMTPLTLYLIGQNYWWEYQHYHDSSFRIYWAAAHQLMYMNNAINFLLYYVSGNRFRKEFKELFHSRRQIYPYTDGVSIIDVQPWYRPLERRTEVPLL